MSEMSMPNRFDVHFFSWADLSPRSDEEEQEYRRGYLDGWVAAIDDLYDIWFLGKHRAYNNAWRHWEHDLHIWRRTNISNHFYFPPRLSIVCVYCGTKKAEQMDHVIPKSRGGSNEESNLAPVCAFCNRSKGAKYLEEWK